MGYINCVLDFLGDDCPNHSKDADNASFFEIIPTFLGGEHQLRLLHHTCRDVDPIRALCIRM